MNAYRKIQVGAAAVIANGAFALGLLSSGPALAGTCGPVTFHCLFGNYGECTLYGAAACQGATPPGCTYVRMGCTYDQNCTSTDKYDLNCLYQ
jgi:hypothetical protein